MALILVGYGLRDSIYNIAVIQYEDIQKYDMMTILDGDATEEEKERLVHTPWFDYDIPFSQAAELGTRKVIEEHSTVGIVVTTDGSVTGIERAAYEEAEKKTIEELKKHQKPFVVVLNTKTPYTLAVKQLTKKQL